MKKLKDSGNDLNEFVEKSERLTLLSTEEEAAVEKYCLYQHERGFNMTNSDVKTMIRDIHQHAVEVGNKRQPLNYSNGPSAKYMRSFYKRHPKLTKRNSESVDRGRINMANQDTIDQYFDLLKNSFVKDGIMELGEDGNVIAESMKHDRVYLADETGWGVQTKGKKVIAKKGASHVYHRKSNDESHKTLMLGICGNGDILKPLVILENSFPLLAEGEGEHIPDNILLSKTDKGSMEKELFVEWIENAVITHKRKVNPDGISYLILDNHGSRFSTKAIDLCIEHHIEVLCYPGHLTHILQGPDVVLNKPISTRVDKMIHNNPIISGNSNLSRIAFIAIVIEAVKTVCTKEKVLMAFSVTGVIPFNPQRIDLSKYPSSMSSTPGISDSPAKVKCRDCRVNDIAIHPLVKNGMVPKHLAEVMLYTPLQKLRRHNQKSLNQLE